MDRGEMVTNIANGIMAARSQASRAKGPCEKPDGFNTSWYAGYETALRHMAFGLRLLDDLEDELYHREGGPQ